MSDAIKNPKLVHIAWHDAHGVDTSWLSESETKLFKCTVYTVGYLVAENKDVIKVAGTFTPPFGNNTEYQHCGSMTIPKQNIIKKTKIKV